MKRRTIIKGALLGGASLTTLPVWSLEALLSPKTQSQSANNFKHLIYDSRYQDSLNMAALAKKNGVAIHPVSDDLTALWNNLLNKLWSDNTVELEVIAGITTRDALFMIEQLAWGKTHKLRAVINNSLHINQAGDHLSDANFGDTELVSWVLTPQKSA